LSKGETVETEVMCTIDDSAKIAVPFFSATIEEPTEHLKMNLTLPPELGIGEVIREVSTGIGALRTIRAESVAVNQRGEASFDVRRPALFHHYEMRWLY
jgi:hypothetical protein